MTNQKAFTLIEVLMAILILAGTSVILYQSWNGSLLAVRKGRAYNTVALLLQKKMVEFETSAKDKGVDEIKEEEKGDFGSDFPEYSWEIKTKPFSIPPIIPPSSSGAGSNELQAIIMKTMTEYFEKAVREVLVTVVYTKGDKSSKYSASTVYIDFKQELPSGF